jgi:hypothetical protein
MFSIVTPFRWLFFLRDRSNDLYHVLHVFNNLSFCMMYFFIFLVHWVYICDHIDNVCLRSPKELQEKTLTICLVKASIL